MTLSTGREAIVLALRQSLYLPLDGLLFITKQYIEPVCRSGVARLEDMILKTEGEPIAPKKKVSDLLQRTGFDSRADQQASLPDYLKL